MNYSEKSGIRDAPEIRSQNRILSYKKAHFYMKVFFGIIAVVPLIIIFITYFYVERFTGPLPHKEKLPCISYSPNDFSRDKYFTDEELNKVLVKVKEVSDCVRIYSVTRGLEKIPNLAEKFGIEVIAGAFLSYKEPEISRQEINNLIEIGKNSKNVKYLIVGNETMLLNELNESELIRYINEVRVGIYGTTNRDKISKIKDSNLYPPITTTELSFIWEAHPKIIESVDVLGLHSFAFWTHKNIDLAIDHVQEDLKKVARLTSKEIVLMETGWPSGGPGYGDAKGSLISQRLYLNQLNESLGKLGIFYSIVELMDVPSKVTTNEGLIGIHWGIFDSKGNQKEIISLKDLLVWIGAYLILMIVIVWYIFGFFRFPFEKYDPIYLRKHDARLEESVLVSFIIITIMASIMATVAMRYSELFGSSMVYLQILFGFISFYAFFELSQKIMQFIISKQATKFLLSNYVRLPKENREKLQNSKVSIHIAAKDEDSDQVIRTIESALNQTHKNIEIIYIDNNSKSREPFIRVKEYFDSTEIIKKYQLNSDINHGKKLVLCCEEFIEGFKAGALNLAINLTGDDVDYIAILDSDYEAMPDWIEYGLNYAYQDIGFIQFPQAYRKPKFENLLSRGARLEQDYVFKVMYPMRAVLGDIVMNGTMVIINKKSLNGSKWPAWTICEDAAMGLSIISNGYRSVFVPVAKGFGSSPENFLSLRKQRNRWVFGSIQILKKLISDIKLRNNTAILYLSDWFGWLMHGLYPVILIFTVSFIVSVWFIYMSVIYDWSFLLGVIFVFSSIFLFIANIIKYLGLNGKNIISLILLELSVVNTISKSVIESIYKSKLNFNVTRNNSNLGNYRITIFSTIKSFVFKFLPWVLIIFACIGSYIVIKYQVAFIQYILIGQIAIVFLPQIIYVYFSSRY